MREYFNHGDIIECDLGEQIILKVTDNSYSIHRTSDFLRLTRQPLIIENSQITYKELEKYLYGCISLKNKPFLYKGNIKNIPLHIDYQTQPKPRKKKKSFKSFNLRNI